MAYTTNISFNSNMCAVWTKTVTARDDWARKYRFSLYNKFLYFSIGATRVLNAPHVKKEGKKHIIIILRHAWKTNEMQKNMWTKRFILRYLSNKFILYFYNFYKSEGTYRKFINRQFDIYKIFDLNMQPDRIRVVLMVLNAYTK